MKKHLAIVNLLALVLSALVHLLTYTDALPFSLAFVRESRALLFLPANIAISSWIVIYIGLLAYAIFQRRCAIQRCRNFHAHPGGLADHAAEKSDVEFPRCQSHGIVRVEHAHFDSRLLHSRDTLSRHQGIGVLLRHRYPGNAGFNQCIAARGSAAVMGAWLQRDVSGGTAHIETRSACGPQRRG